MFNEENTTQNLVNRFDFSLTLKMKALIIFIIRFVETFRLYQTIHIKRYPGGFLYA